MNYLLVFPLLLLFATKASCSSPIRELKKVPSRLRKNNQRRQQRHRDVATEHGRTQRNQNKYEMNGRSYFVKKRRSHTQAREAVDRRTDKKRKAGVAGTQSRESSSTSATQKRKTWNEKEHVWNREFAELRMKLGRKGKGAFRPRN